MNQQQQPEKASSYNDAIADQNVERLITQAYLPQDPDEDFARRVVNRLREEAQRQSENVMMSGCRS